MVIKLFLALLFLNVAVFCAKAYASDAPSTMDSKCPAQQISQANREAMTGQRGETTDEELTTLGMRLLQWHFDSKRSHRYAYENIREDHSISVLRDGAAINLQWRF